MDAPDPSQQPRWEDGEASFPSGAAFRGPGVRYSGTAPLFLGKYRLLSLLGRGGMGVVYAAEHVHSGATVAIKMVVAKDPTLGDRLIRESRALARLGHPKIVQLFDCGITDEGDYYIIMEHVPGVTLRVLMQNAVKKHRRLALRLVLGVVAKTAAAAASAHSVGIVHRDIKPENIMVLKLGDAKLVDFGLAKDSGAVAPADALGAASNPAQVPGTPKYMAPEQVKGGDIDGRTDVYAFGIVLYEAVCGRTPYGDDPAAEPYVVMAHHVHAPPKPIEDFAPDCPDDVRRIIARCIEKDPAQRYQSADELATDLWLALERCVARARAVKAMGRVVRVTEPMPEVREMRPVLPWESAKPSPVTAVVILEAVPPEDEEVTLKRGTMLPAPVASEPPVPPVAAPPAAPAPASPAAPALASASASDPASVPAAATPTASAPLATPGGGTTAGGVTVETAMPPTPRPVKPSTAAAPAAPPVAGPVKPLADAAPVARRTWTMNLPPYSVAALAGVVGALALSFGFLGGGKKGHAQESIASTPVTMSASPAPAPPPTETAVALAPRPTETTAPAPPPPAETATAPAPPPPAETAAPAPPPPKPVAVRTATPPAAVAQPPAVQHKPRELPEGRMVSAENTAQPIKPAPPASTPPPPPAESARAPHRIFGSE